MITPSRALFYLCVSFIVGIAMQSMSNIPHALLWGFLLLGVGCIAVSFFTAHRKKETAVIGFCLLFLVLGITRLQITQLEIANDPLAALNDSAEKLTFQGHIIDNPDVRDTSQKIKVKIDKTNSIVLITTGIYPTYHYLDAVSITGKLKTPFVTEDFNYKNYLMKDGVYSVMDYPKVAVASLQKHYTATSFIYENILRFKATLQHAIFIYFAPPHSSILEGIILGGTSGMSEEVKAKFSATGLTHLTAISGSNIVILSNILMVCLLFFGLWRGQAFYGSVFFIWIYIVIAGFPASGIRAAIMGSIFLLAQKLGRQNTSSRVLVLAGAIMLLQNPLSLFYDVGFQLSFLASMGIICAKPIIDTLLAFAKTAKLRFLFDVFSITMAAQFFTVPIIAYYFKNISLVTPITNMLIIPIVDWIMIFGFLAAFLGIFSYMLGFLFFLPTQLLLLYFTKVMDIFYHPWAVITLQHLSGMWLAGYYLLLAAFMWWLGKKLKPDFLN